MVPFGIHSSQNHNQKCCKKIFYGIDITIFDDPDDHLTQLGFAAHIATIKSLGANHDPFYVMEVGRTRQLLEKWYQMLPRIQPYYSVNCNADRVLLKLLAHNKSVGFYCTTSENLNDTLDCVTSDRVIYSNPCCTRSNLRQASSQGVEVVGIFGKEDLKRVVNYAPDSQLILNICMNGSSIDTNALLGCPMDDASELIRLVSFSGANFLGFGFNLGSDAQHNVDLYSEAIESCAKLCKLANIFGLEVKIISIGGGFASLHREEHYSKFSKVSKVINQALDAYFPRKENPELRIIATPGRFFAGSTYSLVTSVIGKRQIDASSITNDDFDSGNDGYLYQINEGYYGSFGCKMVPECDPACSPLFDGNGSDFGSPENAYGTVLGPYGFESDFDVLQRQVFFRPLHIGDWLIWMNMGAYSFNNAGSLVDSDNFNCGAKTRDVYYFSTKEDWGHIRALMHQNNYHSNNQGSSAFSSNDVNRSWHYFDDEGIGSGSSAEEDNVSLLGDSKENISIDGF